MRALLSRQMLLAAWLPVALVTALHYSTGSEYHWLHDILRRLYYIPIVLGSFAHGLRGGLAVALVVALAYTPHAFTHLMHIDPARTLEKVLELLLYVVVGGVCGLLVDRERARQAELREALDEQRRTADQLVRAGRLAALGELVAGIAHEIKNPLHALRGTAEVVDEAVAQEAPERRMWELHLKELERLGQVAEGFLSFARPTPLERRPVDLIEVVERVDGLVAAEARQREVRLSVEPPAEGVATDVEADPQQLIQVLLNICLNALQAVGERPATALGAEDRGEVRISFGSQPGRRVLRISNDGPSIPEQDLERVFDPFVTTKSEGVGLGLSIAARIVEQHGGSIEVDNLAGGGVAFTLLLPPP